MSEAALAPLRRADRDTTPGRCGNLDYCSIGMQRQLVHVPVGKAFVCPECARPLRPPGRRTGGSPTLLPLLRLLVLGAAVAASLAVGYLIGRIAPTVNNAVQVAAGEVGLAPGQRTAGSGAPAGVAPVAAAPARPIEVAGRGYPSRDAVQGSSAAVQKLGREVRAGQVSVDCLLSQGPRHPACRVTDIRGEDAFSAAAMTWLQGLSVHYQPGAPDSAARSGPDHRWRVTFEDFAGSARPVTH